MNVKNALVIKLSPLNGLNSSMLRTLALIKGLRENGFEIDFVTIKESATTTLNDLSKYAFLNDINVYYANANLAYDRIVKQERKGKIKQLIVSLIRKLYHAVSIFDYTNKISKTISIKELTGKNYEFIISVSDPKTSHKVVKTLKKQKVTGKKWIQYWGDPLALDITKPGFYPEWVYNKIESGLLKGADKVIYTSPFTVEEQGNLFPRYKEKFYFVPTAYIKEKLFMDTDGTYTIGYYGAYKSKVRDIRPLYNACKNRNDLDLNIVGDTDIVLEEKDNIKIYTRREIEEFENNTDLFVCILNKSGTQIPGKLYHYAATNRPVLVIVDGDKQDEMIQFLKNFNRYYICQNEELSIGEAITRIKSESKAFAPLEELSSVNVAKKIIEISSR